jgi:hypothetical protein
MLSTIEAVVLRILGILSQVLTLLGLIQGQTSKAAQENVPFSIDTNVSISKAILTDGTFGNSALLAAIVAVQSQQLADTATLTTLITNLTDGTTPVSLPPTAPSGYGGLSSSDTADAVWGNTSFFAGFAAYNYLLIAGDAGAYLANWYENDNIGRYFQPVFLHIHYTFVVTDDLPVFDPTDILSTEDLKTCLIRQNPTFTVDWTYAPQGTCYLVGSFGADQEDWVTTIDGTYFNLIKAQLFPTTSINAPPVWPGLAGVTLGSPTALSSSLTVSGPMDGVLIDITSVSTNKPALAYGGETAYKFIGALAFVSDNGDVEQFQSLGFQTAIYCPLFLKSADAVVLRVDPSVAGTITPWVIA